MCDDIFEFVEKGNVAMLRVYMELGVDLSYVSDTNSLEVICEKGYPRVLELLIEWGFRCNDPRPDLLLRDGIMGGNVEVVKLLMEAGCRADNLLLDETDFRWLFDLDPQMMQLLKHAP